jgi:hypothetical protein
LRRRRNGALSVCMMIETVEALELADRIAKVPGVDTPTRPPRPCAVAGHPGDAAHPEARRRRVPQRINGRQRVREGFHAVRVINDVARRDAHAGRSQRRADSPHVMIRVAILTTGSVSRAQAPTGRRLEARLEFLNRCSRRKTQRRPCAVRHHPRHARTRTPFRNR